MPNHHLVKGVLLKSITDAIGETRDSENEKVRTDWYSNKSKEYFKQFWFFVKDDVEGLFKNLGYKNVNVGVYWYQQYTKDGCFSWHRHEGSTWNIVYYLELGDNSPRTEFRHPVTQEVFTVEADEGDIIIFPSLLLHRSSVNQTDERKTIIAVNID